MRSRSSASILCALLSASACNGGSEGQPPTAPPPPDPFQSTLALATVKDENPDPRVVEVSLVAKFADWEIAPGQRVHAMTYNGRVPGPLLEAHVGDSVIVHFKNELDQPTTIHWHGVRVPAAMDGSPEAQAPVQPGGKFDYRFDVLDEGTFWYHPHLDEPTQMERGMYGAIVVRGDSEPTFDAEGVVMLDDLTLGADGQIAAPSGPIEEHTGREGPISLLNGRTNVQIPIRAGERQRWRIVNAGSARDYRLAIPGQKFLVLGTDGGPVAKPYEADELFMVPGDRLDVVVTGTGQPKSSVALQNLPYKRGHGGGVTVTTELAKLVYDDGSMQASTLPSLSRTITPLDTSAATVRSVVFDEIIDPNTGDTAFTINGKSYPDVPTFDAHVGKVEVWDLKNNSGMDHPFHLHGFEFQVLASDGPPTSWEDTLNLKAKSTTRIAFSPDDRQGMWMYHCHVLEHAHHGMMGDFHLMP